MRAHGATGEEAWKSSSNPACWCATPTGPDWGLGQVQSVIKGKITVNFEHAGKVVIDGSRIDLAPEEGAPEG